MVFKHNQQPFASDDSFMLTYKQTAEADFGGSFALSACRHNPESGLIPDRLCPKVDLNLENMPPVSPNHNSGSSPCNTAKFMTISCIGGSSRQENNKRPNDDDQSYQFGFKRTRQLDSDTPHSRSTCEQASSLVSAHKEIKSRTGPFGPVSSFTDNCTYGIHEEDTSLEAPIRLSLFPGYYEEYRQSVGSNQLEELSCPVYGHPPRKPVSIGQDHQAHIPVWRDKSSMVSSPGSDDKDRADRWTVFCVMPLTAEGLIGQGKKACHCLDEGSIRCVKQHVAEAREKLLVTLGPERFSELGFCEMGEDVALQWTEEEEQLFYETVESNPASLGRNFWDVLPDVFPSRSSKEIVSYYFNVFMLRKRAEQNRFDPLNVDSDNDEWQVESDRGEDDDDDDDDSGVESPVDVTQNLGVIGEVDIEEREEDNEDEDSDEKWQFGPHLKKSCEDGSPGVGHDDSCTSYEDSGARTDVMEHRPDNLLEDGRGSVQTEYRNEGMSGLTDHDYIAGLCGPRPWDIDYTRGLQKDIDFLPTCSVIEEVFGDEYWDHLK